MDSSETASIFIAGSAQDFHMATNCSSHSNYDKGHGVKKNIIFTTDARSTVHF